MFFIKEEQLCGYLPPLALFLYPVLRHYLRSNAGAAEVSEAQFLMVGALCSPVTPEWPCLCRAGSIILARTIVWESVCSGSTLWSYNFSNYFIFKPGLSLFFCFNWVFFSPWYYSMVAVSCPVQTTPLLGTCGCSLGSSCGNQWEEWTTLRELP